MRKAGLWCGQKQAEQMSGYQVTHWGSLSGTRKGLGREKQQPPRAFNCCVGGKKSPKGVMPALQLNFKEL